MKILNIEDTTEKHMAISREIRRYKSAIIDRAIDGKEGIEKIEKAINEGKAYDLLVIDMHFPVDGILDELAGEYVINELKRKNIDVPVMIFSTKLYNITGIIGSVRYNHRTGEIIGDVGEILAKI